MKFCPNCGNPVQEGGLFCTACGYSLKSVVEEVAQSAVIPEPVVEAPVAEEPVYVPPVQEPVYQEPVYTPPVQEPVYQEPAYTPPVQEPAYAASSYTPPQGAYIPNNYNPYAAPVYGAPAYTPPAAPVAPVLPNNVKPALQLPTGRSWVKMIFLGLITLGIYNIAIMSRIAQEINITSCRYDGRRTMSYFGATMLAPITLFIYPIVWQHKLCNRIGDALQYRGISYKFSASTMWLWGVLGSLIIVGPFIYLHKFMKAMNLVNGDYNVNG